MRKQVCKNKIFTTNLFHDFHFGHEIFIVYIQRYHSTPTQIFIKFEKIYRAACLNSWVVIVTSINFIKFKILHIMQWFDDDKFVVETCKL